MHDTNNKKNTKKKKVKEKSHSNLYYIILWKRSLLAVCYNSFSSPRAVTFWCGNKQAPNFSALPKHTHHKHMLQFS